HSATTHFSSLSLHDALPISIFFHQQIELLGVLRRFAENLKSSDELYITRPGFYADALRFLLRDRLQVLSSRIESNRSALRYVRSDRKSTRLNSSHDQISYAV